MAAAATDQSSSYASSSERPAAAPLRIATWEEEAYELSITIVRQLSAGVLRRDPDAKVRPRQPKPGPIIIHHRAPAIRTRWQIDLEKRAAIRGKSVAEVREEERKRGLERRRKAREEKEGA